MESAIKKSSYGTEALTPEEIKKYKAQKMAYNISGKAWKVFRGFLLFGLCIVIIYPLLYAISVAFRPVADIFDPSIMWIPKRVTLDNFKEVIITMKYPKALVTSLQVNILSALLQVCTCALTGYGFARFNFKGKKAFFGLLLFSILVPVQVIVTPMYLNFKSFNFLGIGSIVGLFTGTPLTIPLLNTPWTFYLPAILACGIKSGVVVYLFKQFFSGMPKELEDAAAIDGCGFMSCFLRIIIPNASAVILTALVLSVVWYWNDYFIGSMMMSGHATVTVKLSGLPSEIAAMNNYDNDPYKMVSKMQAAVLLTIAPVLIMYLIVQKYFVQGVERSGIVG